MRRGDLRLQVGLWAGVMAVSWAAIFIRWAHAPSLAISAWRLALAAAPALVAAVGWHRSELLRIDRRGWMFLAASGVALAVHFATWIASLALTSVASSVFLVTTQPIWVAVLSAWLLHERISRRSAVAIAVALAGGALITGGDVMGSGKALWGDLLALAGAWAAAAYFIIGRRMRGGLSLWAYVGVVYAASAVVLVVWALAAGTPLVGFDDRTWLMLALLAVVPQLLGHSLLNWSLRYLSAPFVSIAILAEPVISTALAIPLLGERPSAWALLGGAVTLGGVYLAVRDPDAA